MGPRCPALPLLLLLLLGAAVLQVFLQGLEQLKLQQSSNSSYSINTGIKYYKNIKSHNKSGLKLSNVSKGAFGEARLRHRRGILELAGAVRCSTGRSPFAYLRYGCYCGLGGKGWPKDRVDWCCFQHDCCYGQAERAGCQPKTEVYHWECEDNAVVCESLEDKCQKMACECDREAAKCFSKAPYHTKFLLWPDFLCGEIQPLCRY